MKRTRKANRRTGQREQIFGRITAIDVMTNRLELEDERHSRTIWLDLRGARMRDLVDSDGDGERSIGDLFPGDRLKIRAVHVHDGSIRVHSLWRLGNQGPAGGLRPLAAAA